MATDSTGSERRPRTWRLPWCTVSTHRERRARRIETGESFTIEVSSTQSTESADGDLLPDLAYDPIEDAPVRELAGATVRSVSAESTATSVYGGGTPQEQAYIADPASWTVEGLTRRPEGVGAGIDSSSTLLHTVTYDVTDLSAALADLAELLSREGWSRRPAPGAKRAWAWIDDDRHATIATPQEDGRSLVVVTHRPS